MYDNSVLVLILHFTELPLCKDTEDITVQPVVNDVSYWVVPKDATTVRVGSPSAAEIHISIPLLTVILLTLQLWDIFVMLDVMLARSITILFFIVKIDCYLVI